MAQVRVRFAPSPTGALHVGSALTALANAAFARARGGVLLLRLDDTDERRSSAALAGAMLETLEWLGISWHEGPYLQSERSAHHDRHLRRLLERHETYHCFCTQERLEALAATQRAAAEPPRYDGACRDLDPVAAADRIAAGEPAVVRLLVTPGEYGFNDMVHGDVAAPPDSFGDFIVRRSDGGFSYLFASVCDDLDLGVTHVLRGEDHLSNTSRQLAVFAALGATPPRFAHLPLLVGQDGSKLSKRDRHGSIDELRSAGLAAETIRAYLSELLGHGACDLLAPDARPFAIERVPRSSPQVSSERLQSLARAQLTRRPANELRRELAHRLHADVPERFTPLIADLAREVATLDALVDEARPFVERPAGVSIGAGEAVPLAELDAYLDRTDTDRESPGAGAVAHLRGQALLHGGPVRSWLQPVRRALTGTDHGPGLDMVIDALGVDEVKARLERAMPAGSTTGTAAS